MSRNVRVAGSLQGEGENVAMRGFALFMACSTALLIFVGGLVTLSALPMFRAFRMVRRNPAPAVYTIREAAWR
jgi:hypothetical protein